MPHSQQSPAPRQDKLVPWVSCFKRSTSYKRTHTHTQMYTKCIASRQDKFVPWVSCFKKSTSHKHTHAHTNVHEMYWKLHKLHSTFVTSIKLPIILNHDFKSFGSWGILLPNLFAPIKKQNTWNKCPEGLQGGTQECVGRHHSKCIGLGCLMLGLNKSYSA